MENLFGVNTYYQKAAMPGDVFEYRRSNMLPEYIFRWGKLFRLEEVVEVTPDVSDLIRTTGRYRRTDDKQKELDVLTAMLYYPFPAKSKSTVMKGWNRQKLVGDVLIVED